MIRLQFSGSLIEDMNKTEIVDSVLDHEPIHFAIFLSQLDYSQYYQTLSTYNKSKAL